MVHIDAAALDAAERFVLRDARLIDRHRFAHQFRGAPGAAVVAALRPYANPDGGFGNALEPDLRGAGSQPEPVAVAFRILDETDGGDAFAGPMVAGACDWLAASSAPDGGVPWVLPSVVDDPRAPWWQPEDGTPGALVPTASIARLLHAHGHSHPWLDGATRFCRERIDAIAAAGEASSRTRPAPSSTSSTARPIAGGPSRCSTGCENRSSPPSRSTRTHPVTCTCRSSSCRSPTGSADGCSTTPSSTHHLDLLVAAQADDGGWGVNWEAWAPVTVPEWRGHVTVERLKLLRAYGRWRD